MDGNASSCKANVARKESPARRRHDPRRERERALFDAVQGKRKMIETNPAGRKKQQRRMRKKKTEEERAASMNIAAITQGGKKARSEESII